jgi:hypothetical protein
MLQCLHSYTRTRTHVHDYIHLSWHTRTNNNYTRININFTRTNNKYTRINNKHTCTRLFLGEEDGGP